MDGDPGPRYQRGPGHGFFNIEFEVTHFVSKNLVILQVRLGYDGQQGACVDTFAMNKLTVQA